MRVLPDALTEAASMQPRLLSQGGPMKMIVFIATTYLMEKLSDAMLGGIAGDLSQASGPISEEVKTAASKAPPLAFFISIAVQPKSRPCF